LVEVNSNSNGVGPWVASISRKRVNSTGWELPLKKEEKPKMRIWIFEKDKPRLSYAA